MQLYRENIDEDQILAEIDPLFERYASEREPEEGFGDFLIRTNVVPAVYDGREFKTGLAQ